MPPQGAIEDFAAGGQQDSLDGGIAAPGGLLFEHVDPTQDAWGVDRRGEGLFEHWSLSLVKLGQAPAGRLRLESPILMTAGTWIRRRAAGGSLPYVLDPIQNRPAGVGHLTAGPISDAPGAIGTTGRFQKFPQNVSVPFTRHSAPTPQAYEEFVEISD